MTVCMLLHAYVKAVCAMSALMRCVCMVVRMYVYTCKYMRDECLDEVRMYDCAYMCVYMAENSH